MEGKKIKQHGCISYGKLPYARDSLTFIIYEYQYRVTQKKLLIGNTQAQSF